MEVGNSRALLRGLSKIRRFAWGFAAGKVKVSVHTSHAGSKLRLHFQDFAQETSERQGGQLGFGWFVAKGALGLGAVLAFVRIATGLSSPLRPCKQQSCA